MNGKTRAVERLSEYIESLNEYIAESEGEMPRKNLFHFEDQGGKARLTD